MTTQEEVITYGKSDNRIDTAFKYFWLGFIIYSLSYTISTSDSVNYILCQILQVTGLISIVSASIILMQWKFDTAYLQVLFTIYISWSLIVVARGFQFNYQFIKFMVTDATFGMFLYFAPLILLFPRNLLNYKKAFGVIVILGFAYIFFDFFFIKYLLFPGRNLKSQAIIEYFSLHLSLPCGLLLLTYMYHAKKWRWLALIVIIFTFLFAAIRARRGLMFMSINILIFSFFMFYYVHKVKILLFIFSAIFISSIYFLGVKIYTSNQSGMFGYVSQRIDENTRNGVEEYFYSGMKGTDWIFGKGINGEYYCPVIDTDTGTLTEFRGVIETGFLQIILKGGILNLVLLLLIIIPAMFKGLFYSKNVLSKAAGILILLFIMDLYPAIPTAFNMNYLLVWISVGICYSKEIRDIPETSMAKILTE
jgi:hypothetical protein